jgi:hypothetical protein
MPTVATVETLSAEAIELTVEVEQRGGKESTAMRVTLPLAAVGPAGFTPHTPSFLPAVGGGAAASTANPNGWAHNSLWRHLAPTWVKLRVPTGTRS